MDMTQEYWTLSYLECLPVEIRENNSNLIREKNYSKFDELQYMYLRNINTVLPTLKERLHNESDVHIRINIYSVMLKCCMLNMDLNFLEELLQLAADKCGNDQLFLTEACDSFCSIPNNVLQDRHKKHIKRIILILFLQFNCVHGRIVTKMVPELIKTNYELTFKLIVVLCVKHGWHGFHIYAGRMSFLFKKHIYFDSLLEEARKHINMDANLFILLISFWNKFNKNDQCRPKQWLIDIIHKYIQQEKNISNIKYIGKMKSEVYSMILIKQINVDVYNYYLRRDQRFIKDHFEDILNVALETKNSNCAKYLYQVKLLEFLNIKDKIKDILVNKFNTADHKPTVLMHLSHIVDAESFADFIKDYIPTDLKIDHEDNLELNELRIASGKCILNLKNLSVMQELIPKYLGGDHVHNVTPGLFYMVLNVKQEIAKQFLLSQLDKPVAVKKKILRLLYLVLNIEKKLHLFQELWTKENHPSVRSFLILLMSRLLVDQKSDRVWQVIKKFITESNQNSLGELVGIEKIPKMFISDYFIAVWNKYKNIENEKEANTANNFLNSVSFKNMTYLYDDTVKMVIDETLFKHKDILEMGINHFIARYLISRCLVQDDVSFLKAHFNESVKLKAIRKFFKAFFSEIFGVLGTLKPDSLKPLFQIIESILLSKNMLDDYFLLRLVNLYILCAFDNTDVKVVSVNFGIEVGKMFEGLSTGFELSYIFINVLKHFVDQTVDTRTILDTFSVTLGIVSHPVNNKSCVLASAFLYKIYIDGDHFFEEPEYVSDELNRVICVLKEVKDPTVVVYLNKFLNSSSNLE